MERCEAQKTGKPETLYLLDDTVALDCVSVRVDRESTCDAGADDGQTEETGYDSRTLSSSNCSVLDVERNGH